MKVQGFFSKNEIIKQIKLLEKRGWLELSTKRIGRDGGLGNSLEDYLAIEENNLAHADLGTYELKTHRRISNSLITIFHKEPGPEGVKNAFIPFLINNYGWPISQCPTKINKTICPHDPIGKKNRCYPSNEKSLRIDMSGKKPSERGFIIHINKKLRKLEIHFDYNKVKPKYGEWLQTIKETIGLNDLDERAYWSFDVLQKLTSKKITNMLYVTFDTKKEESKEYKKIIGAQFLENFNFENFLDAIEKGFVLIEFNARTGHNHGTAFRTFERNWPYFYDKIELLI